MNPLRRLAATGIERARSARPVTWLTLVGVLLLPALIGGALVAALYNPTERLDNMTAAIVNNDEPVTVQDQYTPLGRQLAAGLVEGSDDVASNLTWVLSNEEDAEEGLADGTYQAVVTIPEEFSAAATSSGQRLSGEDAQPEQARIQVVTAPDARLADEAITNQVATVAASSMGQMLSQATLSNVFIGFTTLGEQLGEAADGAAQLADGAGAARDGASELADGASQLGSGAGELATGADRLADGAGQVSSGAVGLAGGAAELANGARGIADGASQLSDGASQLAAGLNGDGTADNPGIAPSLRGAADGAGQLVEGLRATASDVERTGQLGGQALVPAQLTQAAQGAAQASAGVAQGLEGLSAACAAQGGSAEFCGQLAALVPIAQGASTASGGTSAGVSQLASALPAGIATALRATADQAAPLSGGLDRLADGTAQAATGASQLATGLDGLSGGAGQLAGGADQLAGGAGQLASGATGLATGTDQLASGAGELSNGASQLADGTSALGDGIGELAGGTRSLADGLDQATEQLPTYSEREADDLATVISDPVSSTAGSGVSLFGAAAVPLLAAIVLWFGGLATFVVMRSVTGRALTSRRASATLAGGALLPAAIVGAVQGVLVAAVVQLVSGYDAGTAGALFALCALIGVAFAAVHQALVAVFGGAGRWIAALVGALAVATGIVSTLPGWLADIADALPTAPAYRALLGTVTDAGGTGAAVVGLLVWAVLGFVATTLAVTRKRTASSKLLLGTAPA
jgi:putative membrane protein